MDEHSLPDSLPSAGQSDDSMKKPRCNSLLQRGLQCRGDWIRTSDLLNPIQGVRSSVWTGRYTRLSYFNRSLNSFDLVVWVGGKRAAAHTLGMNKPTTVSDLVDHYLTWLVREVRALRVEARTLEYYGRQLKRFVAGLGDGGSDRRLDSLIAFDLEKIKSGWHSVQAVQRLFNWGVKVGLVEGNPFAGIERPQLGQRSRTLSRGEMCRLLYSVAKPFRLFLVAMRHTLARPQEIRQLRWADLNADGTAFVLTKYKAKKRRKDKAPERLILLDAYMQGLIRALQANRRPALHDPVFTNRVGEAWTANAVRCAMRTGRARAGLNQPGMERVVAYTMRHTAATDATANNVRDRTLADLMGHASTKTTARYQHLGGTAPRGRHQPSHEAPVATPERLNTIQARFGCGFRLVGNCGL